MIGPIMDEDLARIVIGNAARAAGSVGNLVPMLKDKCEPELYDELKRGVGGAVYGIYESILEPVWRRFPHLKEEFERNIERYGPGC